MTYYYIYAKSVTDALKNEKLARIFLFSIVLDEFISYTITKYCYEPLKGVRWMKLKNQQAIPRYQQIAVELASSIAREEYTVGQKIFARSAIASHYGVSPETARRAICVLADLDIVTAAKGSGVIISSQANAELFLKQFSKRKTISSIKETLLDSIQRQKAELETFSNSLYELMETYEHFRSLNPFMPFQLRITKDCRFLNKSIADIQFWQHTGATLIAIEREDRVLKSPGPYIPLIEGDILYFLSQDDSSQRVNDFLYPPQNETNTQHTK